MSYRALLSKINKQLTKKWKSIWPIWEWDLGINREFSKGQKKIKRIFKKREIKSLIRNISKKVHPSYQLEKRIENNVEISSYCNQRSGNNARQTTIKAVEGKEKYPSLLVWLQTGTTTTEIFTENPQSAEVMNHIVELYHPSACT